MRKPLNLVTILIALVLSACDTGHTSSDIQHSAAPNQAPSALNTLGISIPHLERIETILQQEVDEGIRAGFVAMVAKDGEIVYQTAVGMADRENNIAMSKDTRFRIASMTKAITTVALMQLVENGSVLLSDPVSKYIPGFSDMVVATSHESKADGTFETIALKHPITLHHLLTHTSGLDYAFEPKTDLDRRYNESNLYRAEGDLSNRINALTSLPLYEQPGEKYRYSYGIDVAGLVVEVVSGKTLEIYFRENIFEPLEMKDTEFFIDQTDFERLAVVYDADVEGQLIRATNDSFLLAPNEKGQGWMSGGGGLVSSTNDYMRFYLMLLNKGQLGGKRLLSPASVSLMFQRNLQAGVEFSSGSTFGLGGFVVEHPGMNGAFGEIGDWGWGGYYGTSATLSPSKNLAVIVMSQQLPWSAPISRASSLVQTIAFGALDE